MKISYCFYQFPKLLCLNRNVKWHAHCYCRESMSRASQLSLKQSSELYMHTILSYFSGNVEKLFYI